MLIPKSRIEPFGYTDIPQVHVLMGMLETAETTHRYAKVLNAFFHDLRMADATKDSDGYETVALRVKAELADFVEKECKK